MLEIYILLFLGVLLSGEVVWAPALYLGYLGKIDITNVFLIGLFAVFIMDNFWYFFGRVIGARVLEFSIFKRKMSSFKKLFDFFTDKQIPIIFISKFFLGTRVISQVLAGSYKMNYGMFFVVTSVASFVWSGMLLLIVYSLGSTLQGVEETTRNAQIFISIFIIIFIGANFLVRRILMKRKERKGNI